MISSFTTAKGQLQIKNKSQIKLDRFQPTHPSPSKLFLDTHHSHGQNTQIIITNNFKNVYTNRIHMVYYSKISGLV